MPDPDQEHTERREALAGEYTAVVGNFRELTEIRFKLLNLLPLASLAAAAPQARPRSPGSLPFALFGLAATIAIAAYNSVTISSTTNWSAGRPQSNASSALRTGLTRPGLRPGSVSGCCRNGVLLRRSTVRARCPGQRRDQEQPRRACKALWKGPLNWTVNHGLSVAAIYFITATFWLYLALEAAGAAIAGIPPIRSDLDWLKASLGPQTVSAALRWLLAALAFFLTLAVACRLKDREETRRERDEGGRQARRRKHHERGKGLPSTELGLYKSALDRALSSDAVVSGAFLTDQPLCPRQKLHHGKLRASRRQKGYSIA